MLDTHSVCLHTLDCLSIIIKESSNIEDDGKYSVSFSINSIYHIDQTIH